jgi:hypothetical protein
VLWLLMICGHAICALLLRQMEYDADRVETVVAGSAAFESTTLKLASLGAIFSDIHHEMARVWRKQFQLPDNLPVLIEYRANHLSVEKRAKIENGVLLTKTGVLDTHPSPGDRITAARRLAEPGYEISDEPARDLFDGFEAVSRLVTLAHYEDDLNVPTSEDFLIPLEQVIGGKTKAEAAAEAPAPPPAPVVPMMRYDPSGFQKPQEPGS